MSPHQKAIHRIAKRIKKSRNDLKIFENLDYENMANGEKGECDILALCGFYNAKRKYAILIEVKSSRKQEHKKKAARQLERGVRDVKAFYGDNVRCFCLSVYTSNNYFRNSRWISKPYDINWIRES